MPGLRKCNPGIKNVKCRIFVVHFLGANFLDRKKGKNPQNLAVLRVFMVDDIGLEPMTFRTSSWQGDSRWPELAGNSQYFMIFAIIDPH